MDLQKQIFSLVEDIVNLVRRIKYIKFNYYKRSANFLTGRLAKKAHDSHYNMFFFVKS